MLFTVLQYPKLQEFYINWFDFMMQNYWNNKFKKMFV